MKQQTPLRKAIAEIETVIADFNKILESSSNEAVRLHCVTCTAVLKTVAEETLTNLLPEERRVIEEAYREGDLGRDSASDFFTSNFEQ